MVLSYVLYQRHYEKEHSEELEEEEDEEHLIGPYKDFLVFLW